MEEVLKLGFQENKIKRLVEDNYLKKINSLKIEKGNTIDHEMLKFLVCFILKNQDREFITEARLKTGGRCDVLDLSRGVVIEILTTEKEANIEKKKDYYSDLPIIPILSKDYLSLGLIDLLKKLSKEIS